MNGIYMRFGKNQKKILEILKAHKEGVDEVFLSNEVNTSKADILRITLKLEDKKCVKKEHEDFHIRKDLKFIRALATSSERAKLFNEIKESFIFENCTDSIKIETNLKCFIIFRENIKKNKSLNLIKEKDFKKYSRLVLGLKETLIYQLKILEKKVYNWSNGDYKIICTSKKICLLDSQKSIIEFREEKKKSLPKYKILSEIIFLIYRTLNEINDHSISISTKDYSDF